MFTLDSRRRTFLLCRDKRVYIDVSQELLLVNKRIRVVLSILIIFFCSITTVRFVEVYRCLDWMILRVRVRVRMP